MLKLLNGMLMKDWMCWVLLVVGIALILWFGWWLTTVLSLWTSIYVTIVLNGIVMCYNMIEFRPKKK